MFSILPGVGVTYLSVDPVLGNISFAVDYDVDNSTLPRYLETIVIVTDQLGLTGSTNIIVNIEDVNDNAPLFGASFYMTSLPVDSPVGTVIMRFNASDADGGQIIMFDILYSTNISKMFNITDEGDLVLVSKLSGYEHGTILSFTVVVSDSGMPKLSSSSVVEIIITDMEQQNLQKSSNHKKSWGNDGLSHEAEYTGMGVLVTSFLLLVVLIVWLIARHRKPCGENHNDR